MYDSKKQEYEIAIRKLRKQIKERTSENRMLEIKIREFASMVEERENIHQLQRAGTDLEASNHRLKELRSVCKLHELSDAQEREMKLLEVIQLLLCTLVAFHSQSQPLSLPLSYFDILFPDLLVSLSYSSYICN